MAPEVFKRVDGMSAVAAQPSSGEDRTKALQVSPPRLPLLLATHSL
jgi:hypothetical protein